MPVRTALLAVTGNAVIMGAAGVSAPIGWLVLPGVAGMSSRPRVSALVAGWAGVLILASVALPMIPGHRGDTWSLTSSGIVLTLMPALSWLRQQARRHQANSTGPVVETVGAGQVGRPVVLARSGLPGEIATTTAVPGTGLWVLTGMVMGDVTDRVHCAREVERALSAAASRPGTGLAEVAAALEPVARRHASGGYVSATLLFVTATGTAQVLRCGSPEILAVPVAARQQRAGPHGVVVDAGPGGWPLGLAVQHGCSARRMPDNARIAVVTAAYACAHYDDYIDAVCEALQARSVELSAVRLLLGPSTGAGSGVVGPALVLGAVTDGEVPAPEGRSR
jgi:hypothetical protein